MRWARNLARIGDRRGAYRVLVGKRWGKRLLGKRGADGKIILKWIYGKVGKGHGLDCSGSGLGQVAGCCECGDETTGPRKGGEFLD